MNFLIQILATILAERQGGSTPDAARDAALTTMMSDPMHGLILASVRRHLDDPTATVALSPMPGNPHMLQAAITCAGDEADRLETIRKIQASFIELGITEKKVPPKP
jgi:hypothetical protein